MRLKAKHLRVLERRYRWLREQVISGQGNSYEKAEVSALEAALEILRIPNDDEGEEDDHAR